MRVLLINHTGVKGGAEVTLLNFLASVPSEVQPLVACPEGPLAEGVRTLGVPISTIPRVDASVRLHPLHTPRGLFQTAAASLEIGRLMRRFQPDLVHANSVRAGLAAALPASLRAASLVIHVRDCLPDSALANLARRLALRKGTTLLANSRYTAQSFAAGVEALDPTVVYNPVDLERFDPDRISREEARRRLGLAQEEVALGVIAQVTPWKGQDTAVQALQLLRQQHPGVRLLLVGEAKFAGPGTRYDNRSYLASLHRLVEEHDLGDAVRFLGERPDVPEILRALDLLLVPSWEEPFGLVVIEGMAMGTAVAATAVGGTTEVIEDGTNGILVRPREPVAWARAIGSLLDDPQRRQRIATAGRSTAQAFTQQAYVDGVVGVYRHLVAGRTIPAAQP